MSGSGPIYEYQREVTAQLEQALRERDEARAEVERLGAALTQETRLSLHTQRRLEEAEASTESLTAEFQRAVADCDEARAEVERLRQIVSECAAAIGNGSFASPECSLEFMAKIPAEIAAETKRGRKAYQRGAEAMREAGRQLLVREWIHASQRVVELFVALPVPEDKQ